MQILKYNNQQLSLFDFEKANLARHEVISTLRKSLGLINQPSSRKMLEACIARPELFTYPQREFLMDAALVELDSKRFTDKQLSYLKGLYFKTGPLKLA